MEEALRSALDHAGRRLLFGLAAVLVLALVASTLIAHASGQVLRPAPIGCECNCPDGCTCPDGCRCAGAAKHQYRWQPFRDGDVTQVMLVDGPPRLHRQVGTYVYATRLFFLKQGLALSDTASPPPIPPPEPPGGGMANFGVHLAPGHPITPGRNTIGGREVTHAEALRALGGPSLPDDAALQRLTIIGDEADRKRVLGDLLAAPELAEWRTRLVVRDFPADHWALRCGFVTDGGPTIYLQAPDGKVLLRRPAYDGPADLAGALRRAQPDYDPSKDPDCRPKPPPTPEPPPFPEPAPEPTPSPAPTPQSAPAAAVPWQRGAMVLPALAAVGGLALLFPRRKKVVP